MNRTNDKKVRCFFEKYFKLHMGVFLIAVGLYFDEASTGGTDILAKLLNKISGVPIGRSLFLADAFITLMAIGVFGLRLGLLALLGVLLNGLLIDRVIGHLHTLRMVKAHV